ncbi:MAG TPA: alpha/beta hydrolase [Acidimicrobiales bacterium]|nr:alpha/beta hydrolase [Acidimicrobiales bacterium]
MHEATWLTIHDTEVFVQVAGTGTPVLCVHTAGQSGVQYRELLQRLPAFGYQVVVIDLPGHGRSMPAPGGPVTDLHEYGEICWEVIEGLSLEKPNLLGCSIGGKIVLDLCVHHGDDVRAAVVMEADAHNGALSVAGLRRSMSDAASPAQGDRTYYGTLASLGTAVASEKGRLIADMHRREDSIVTSSDLIGWTTHDVTEGLALVRCPMLVVAGSDDFWVREENCRIVAENVVNGEFLLLPGVGHYPMEELEDFPELLAAWLDGLLEKSNKIDRNS